MTDFAECDECYGTLRGDRVIQVFYADWGGEHAAVVGKVRDYLEEGKGAYAPDLLDILTTATADALREHDAKVRAEALREFAHSIPGDVHDPRHVADLARGVADHIEREAGLK